MSSRKSCVFFLVAALLAVLGQAAVPTFTWVSQGNYYTCPDGGAINPVGYNNALYYQSFEIGQCTWCYITSTGEQCETTNFIEGTVNMDQGNQFALALPQECDIGTDKTMACIANDGGSMWWDNQGGGTMQAMCSSTFAKPIKAVSVGSASWMTMIDASGWLYSWVTIGSASCWLPVSGSGSGTMMYTSIGEDGIIGILYTYSTAPVGCQMNSDGTLSGCKVLGGATGDIPGCIQVLNANNILAWNQWGLYWLVGGYNGNQEWAAVSGLPVPFDKTCFLSTTAFTCISRPNLGGKDSSGNAYFTYKGTDGNWHSAKYPQA